MLDFSKKYQTRSGKKVLHIHHIPNNPPQLRIFALIENVGYEGITYCVRYYEDGKYLRNKEDPLDLVPIPEPKPFGELSREEQIKLFEAWLDGKTIENFDDTTGRWIKIGYPSWWANTVYRIKEA